GIEIVLPATLSPGFVITGEILLEHQSAVAGDDHAVNVGLGFLQPGGDAAKPRAIEADTVRGIDDPAIAKRRGHTASRVGLAQGLRGGCREQDDGGEAEAPQSCATLVHVAVSISRCYAGGGTEIFTEGRSSIFW